MDSLAEKLASLAQRFTAVAAQQTALQQQMAQLLKELDSLRKAAATVEQPPTTAQQASTTQHETSISTKTGTEAGISSKEVEAGQKEIPPIEATQKEAVTITPAGEKTPPVGEKVITFPDPIVPPAAKVAASTTTPSSGKPLSKSARNSSTMEEFLGKNLASKVGILITIVGIFIGAKYAIDHNLVSPAVRIIIGYLFGLALTGLGVKLKAKYKAYSAVLTGGGLSVLYFITYIAYSFYGMMPQWLAFGGMLIVTAASVYAALKYDMVIIAHLGQVGAYAIPFLLSDQSGRYVVFFSYMALINAGILILSLRKYWKSLFYSSFVITWFIVVFWSVSGDNETSRIGISLTFASIFFLIFYAALLAYKLARKENLATGDTLLVLLNALVFYGVGVSLLAYHDVPNGPGIFTLANALFHFAVSLVVKKIHRTDRLLYNLLQCLAISFATLVIPIQWKGHTITLLWAVEAAVLFYLGRKNKVSLFEILGGAVAILSFLGLLANWSSILMELITRDVKTPFANGVFVTGVCVVAAYGIITWIDRKKQWRQDTRISGFSSVLYPWIIPVLLIVAGYFVFRLEIYRYFISVKGSGGKDGVQLSAHLLSELRDLSTLYGIGFSILFVIVVMGVNRWWVRNKWLRIACFSGCTVLMVVLLFQGLPLMNNRSAAYFEKGSGALHFGPVNLFIRYLLMGALAILLNVASREVKEKVTEPVLQKAWWLMLYTVILGCLSFEYLHWTQLNGSGNQYKLGLSVVWGVFALGLIVYGIWKKQRYVRLAAMVLLIVTLLKLFIYDLAGAGTIIKTVSFISLGVILLLISYLYNRYKEVLFGKEGGG